MKKLFTLTITSLIAMTIGAQTFSYGWHNTHNDETSYHTYETKVVGDTVFALYTFNGDTLDADPSAGQDWIYDSSIVSWSQVVYLSKFTTAGQYVSSSKLMEKRSGGFGISDFEIDNNGQIILIGNGGTTDIDFDPTTNVVGSYLSPSSFSIFQFIVFYTAAGTYSGHIEYLQSSNSDVYFEDAVIDSTNRMYVVGQFKGTVDFDFTAGIDSLTSVVGGASWDCAVLCIDLSAQTYVWGRGFGSDQSDFIAYAAVNAGKLFLYGSFEGTSIDLDPGAAAFYKSKPAGTNDWDFIARWNLSGSLVNSMVFGGMNQDVYPGGIVADAQGNVYISGNCEYHDSVDVDPGAGVHLLDIPENYGCFLVKYGPTFSMLWATTFNSAYIEQTWSFNRNFLLNGTSFIAIGADIDTGSVYAMQNGNSTPLIAGGGLYGIFLAGVNKSTGAVATSYSLRGDSAVNMNSWLELDAMAMDADDHVYLNGAFNGLVDFNPADAVVAYDTSYLYPASSLYYDRPYLLKLNTSGFTSVPEVGSSAGINAYPNPTGGMIFLESETAIESIEVTDVYGKLVSSSLLNGAGTAFIDLSMNTSGIYFIRTTDVNGSVSTVKIIRR